VRLNGTPFRYPYRKKSKKDDDDGEAICEAVGRSNMRFIPVKTEVAQAVLTLHQARELLVSKRVALSDKIRGSLFATAMQSWEGATIPLARVVFAHSELPFADSSRMEKV
jgi:hypothetical protein